MSPSPSTDCVGNAGHASLRIAGGSLYLDRSLCERYLRGVTSVAVLARDGQVLLLPLHGATAGGLLLKVRNARGDCVTHAPEFLRSLGIDEHAAERNVPVRWVTEMGGLVLEGLQPVAASTPDGLPYV